MRTVATTTAPAAVTKLLLCTALIVPLAFTGCGQTGALRLAGTLSYASIYAEQPSLILEGFKSRFSRPFSLETVPAKALLDDLADGRVDGAFVRGAPFYMQAGQGCGAAALAGMFAFYEKPVPLEEINREIINPLIGGALCIDMIACARKRDFWCQPYPGSTEYLCEDLAAGIRAPRMKRSLLILRRRRTAKHLRGRGLIDPTLRARILHRFE